MKRLDFFLIFIGFGAVFCQDDIDNIIATKEDILEPMSFVNWPNGTIPFYINSEHFDNEQTLIIMTSLSIVAFKTCLKFSPVMVPPEEHQHVLVFENPRGTRKCEIEMRGHPRNEPHIVILGYDCLKAPWMDRIVLRALGLPFEHNRQVRDTYIDVQYENIEQHAIPLYTKDISLPAALRALPYDINSVMHFGERDYSKNGHRTIIFKDRTIRQKWEGLSELDIRKIEIIYGPECRERDRQEKIELCHMYPGIPPLDRKKRSVDSETTSTKSLRVNPDITPPPENGLNISKEVQATLNSLGIEQEVAKIVEDVFKVSNRALSKTREKYCNETKQALRTQVNTRNDILGIIEVVSKYAQAMVDDAVNNLESFCAKSESLEKYQRFRCADGCYRHFYSTKNSLPHYSTRHKPQIPQSTWHIGGLSKPPYDNPYRDQYLRARPDNGTEKTNETVSEKPHRRRREVYKYPKYDKNGKLVEESRENNKKKGSGKYSEEDERYDTSDERWSKKKKRPNKKKYADKDEIYDSRSEERFEGKKKQPMKYSDDSDRETITHTRKPDNKDRFKVKKKVPMTDYSDERDRQSTTRTRKPDYDDRQNKKSTRSVMPDSEENPKSYSDDDKHEGKNKKKTRRPLYESEEKPKKVIDESAGDKSSEGKKKKTRRPLYESGEIPKKVIEAREQSAEGPPKIVVLSKRNREFYDQRRWPEGVVRYMIDTTCTEFDLEDLRRRLAEVNAILRRRTCARIEEILPGEEKKYKDYLLLDNSPDFVTGRVGGRQVFGVAELLVGGQHRQHAAMVVMAMLGFYFELSRHDRDDYVKVHSRHVRPDKLHHFEKIGSDATFPLPYDYDSATQPAWMFWRKLGKKGISAVATYKDKDPDGSIMKSFGQHKKLLSESDIIKINTVYGIKCLEKSGKTKEKRKEQISDSD